MREKGFASIIILLVLVGVGLLVFFGYFYRNKLIQPTPEPTIFSTPTTTTSVTPDPTANWKTYIDPNKYYEFKYPSSYSLGHFAGNDTPLLLNNRIEWTLSQYTIADCKGDCPIITNKNESQINGYNVTIYKGWVGAVGGNTPQSFIWYEIQEPAADRTVSPNYFVIILWELDRTSSFSPTRDAGEIGAEDIKVFEQIVSTFKFTQ